MVEFTIRETRTDGLGRTEIAQGLYDGTLNMCPYQDLSYGEEDAIMDDFLKLGEFEKGEPRTMSILELGLSSGGVPCAVVECVNRNGCATKYVPSICEFCARLGGCSKGDKFAVSYDFWDGGSADDGD